MIFGVYVVPWSEHEHRLEHPGKQTPWGQMHFFEPSAIHFRPARAKKSLSASKKWISSSKKIRLERGIAAYDIIIIFFVRMTSSGDEEVKPKIPKSVYTLQIEDRSLLNVHKYACTFLDAIGKILSSDDDEGEHDAEYIANALGGAVYIAEKLECPNAAKALAKEAEEKAKYAIADKRYKDACKAIESRWETQIADAKVIRDHEFSEISQRWEDEIKMIDARDKIDDTTSEPKRKKKH